MLTLVHQQYSTVPVLHLSFYDFSNPLFNEMDIRGCHRIALGLGDEEVLEMIEHTIHYDTVLHCVVLRGGMGYTWESVYYCVAVPVSVTVAVESE